jgi:PAS domain S-box-containing protein
MTHQDSNEPDQILARLRASEELYARTFMTNPVAMSITDLATGRFTHINLAFAAMVGYNRSEIIGRTSEEMKFWLDRSNREGIMRRIQASDDYPLVKTEIRHKSGDLVQALVSFRLLAVPPASSVLSVLVPLPQAVQSA